MVTNKECELCPLVIVSREFYANFLVIDGGGYDFDLGMDWSRTFHVVIDCTRT